MKHVRNCDQCRKRKLKCDRVMPCGPCRTRNCASSCIFSGLPGNNLKDRETIDFGHPRPKDEVNEKASAAIQKKTQTSSSSKNNTFISSKPFAEAANYPLPSEQEITRFADCYYAEQDRGYTTYIITRSAFDKGRIHAKNDPAWRSLVHAICGIGVLFMARPDPSIFAPHLLAAEALLDHHCDTDRHPELIHVRIIYLLVLGLGPLRGPHLLSRVQQGVFLAHILNLHLEPDERLPLVEKQDRVILFSSITKMDYFSALGTGRTFTMTKPDAEALPSLFGLLEGGENILGLDQSILFSLRMGNIARKIVDRERRNRKKWYEITIELKEEILSIEQYGSQLKENSNHQISSSNNLPKTNLAFDSALFRVGFCSLRWCLFKPFYLFQGTMYKPQYHDLHVACVEAAFKQMEALQDMFEGYVETYLENTFDPPSPPKRVEMLGVWYPIFLTLRCALFIKNHLDFLERLPVQDSIGKSEQTRCSSALRTMRWLLKAISKHSVIARDGLMALQDSNKMEDHKSVQITSTKRKADVMMEGNGANKEEVSIDTTPSLPTNISTTSTSSSSSSSSVNQQPQQSKTINEDNDEVPSSILDDLLVFNDQNDDGSDFWDMISWMEPKLA